MIKNIPHYLRQALLGVLLLAVWHGPLWARDDLGMLEVLEVNGTVEYAQEPAELLRLLAEGPLTLRTLRAFDRLPDAANTLALELRRQGINLFRADHAALQDYLQRIEAGTLNAQAAGIEALLVHLENQAYLDWQPLLAGQYLDPQPLIWVRGSGEAIVRAQADETLWQLSLTGDAQALDVGNMLVALTKPETHAAAPFAESESMTETPTADDSAAEIPALAALSASAQALHEGFLGWLAGDESFRVVATELAVEEAPDGTLNWHSPHALLHISPDGEDGESFSLDLGEVTATLRPQDDGAYSLAIDLSPTQHLLDEDGEVMATLHSQERTLHGLWDAGTQSLPALDVVFTGLDVVAGALADDAQTPSGSYAPTRPHDFYRAHIEQLRLENQTTLDDQGHQAGIGRLSLEGMQMFSLSGHEVASLAKIGLQTQHDALDEQVFTGLLDELTEQAVSLDPLAWMQKLLEASGLLSFSLALEKLAVQEPDGEDYIRLDGFLAKLRLTPSDNADRQRDLSVQYRADGLEFLVDEMAGALAAVEWNMQLQQLAPLAWVQLFSEGPGADPGTFAQSLLRQLTLSSQLQGLSLRQPGQSAETLAQMELQFSLNALDTQTPSAELQYLQHGTLNMDENLPAELNPHTVVFDIALQRLPLSALLTQAMSDGMLNPEFALQSLLAHATQLDIREWRWEFPLSTLLMQANAQAQAGAADAAPHLQAEARIDLHDLERMGQWAAGFEADPMLAEQLRAMIAMLGIIGEKKTDADGKLYHHYHIEADSLGQMKLNGNDMSALMSMMP